MKLTISTPEECPFRKIHYASQFYWYQKCFLVEKPEACLVLCSENRCPLQKKGSATVIWSIQNEKDSESGTQSRREAFFLPDNGKPCLHFCRKKITNTSDRP